MTRNEFETRLRVRIDHAQQLYSGYHRPDSLLTKLVTQEVMAVLDEVGLLNALTVDSGTRQDQVAGV